MADMPLQECIARLEDLIQDRKSFFTEDGDDDVFRTDAAALEKAVSMLHKIASGEYKPVIHACWIDTDFENSTGSIYECSSCHKLYNPEKKAVALGRQKENPANCPYCGALMDEKDGAK